MRHHHITRVLYIALVAVFLSTGLVVFAYSQTQALKAQAASLQPYIEYQGFDLGPTPNLITVPGAQVACPYYYTMQNLDINPDNPFPEFGLFIIPGGEALTYDYTTLPLISSCHMGGYVPIPMAACGLTPTGGPVFPIYLDASHVDSVGVPTPLYLDGGSGVCDPFYVPVSG